MKNIYMFILRTAVYAAVGIQLVSCLEKYPGDYIPEEDAMQTYDEAEQTVTGIYTMLRSNSLYSGYLTLLPDIQADLVYAVEGNTNTYGQYWLWDIRPTNSEIEAVYAGLYSVIGSCNFFLDKVVELRKSLTDDEKITSLDLLTGEVHAARALSYLELLKMYCKPYDPASAEDEMGVVLRTSYFKKENIERADLKKSYEFVLSELGKAEELLDEEYDGYNAPLFTHAAVKAVQARTALYMQDWDKAIEYSSELIDSETFTLSPVTSYATDSQTWFDYLWTNDYGPEVILRLGCTPTSYGGALGKVFLNFTNNYQYYYPDYVPAQWVLDLYSSSDYRKRAYFYEITTGYAHQLTWPLLVKYHGNETMISAYIYHVCMPKPLRLAEQYLIRAEAYCNKGEYGRASADLTALRKARFISGGSITLTEKNWQQAISDERVRELYMEGFRLHDLKRWGWVEGFEREPQTSSQAEGSSIKIKKGDYRFVWPIPKHEIEAPGSRIKQNENY